MKGRWAGRSDIKKSYMEILWLWVASHESGLCLPQEWSPIATGGSKAISVKCATKAQWNVAIPQATGRHGMWSSTLAATYTSDEAFNTRRSTFDDESNKAGAELLLLHNNVVLV